MPHAAFLRREGRDGPEIVFFSPTESVGERVVTDKGEELTVSIGTFTHGHWSCPDGSIAAEQRPDWIARNVLDFIAAILSDKIEFFGGGAGGGSRPVGKPRGWLSKFFFGAKTYRWSGPVTG